MTREDVQRTLERLAASVVDSHFIQSMILLDHVLRQPNSRELFDAEMREQARDLWLKMKSTGLKLNDPPLLFDN